MFSQFVADMHKVGRQAEVNVAAYGFERLRAMLGFECAWYGWARFMKDRTLVHASSTMNLPTSFAKFWSTIANQDLVAKAIRENRGGVIVYDRRQPAQTDGMIELSERYQLRKWATAMHSRPCRDTAFFASVYRTDRADPEWEPEDLQLLQCAVDHIFLAMKTSIRDSNRCDRATLLVDPSGFAHLGLDGSETLLRSIWPGWKGERLPRSLRPFIRRSGTFTLENEGLVISCSRDRQAGDQSELMRIELGPASKVDRLSPRERDVARLLARGASYKEAARTLGSAPATIRNQTQSIYGKLGIGTRAQLVELVLQHGEGPKNIDRPIVERAPVG
jgi:DNA-binding CsgD family transcriptional regulator